MKRRPAFEVVVPAMQRAVAMAVFRQHGWTFKHTEDKMLMTDEEIARVAHEVNRAYCAATDDPTHMPWEIAPDWQKQSAINGVRFHRENPGSSPAASHENWLAEKMREGWTYGPVKDPVKREHPCFLPYDRLPEAQRVKDYLFIAVVRSLDA